MLYAAESICWVVEVAVECLAEVSEKATDVE